MKRGRIQGRIQTLCLLLLCLLCFFAVRPIAASADTGPKPSIQMTFENMGESVCYGTLLSKTDSTGPHSAWTGDDDYKNPNGFSDDIWLKFVQYEDIDGYYFLQMIWNVGATKKISWGYYPPTSFKILLYYPETDTYVASGIYERYAFDSYFNVDMSGVDVSAAQNGVLLQNNGGMKVYRAYDYTSEIWGLIARIAITVAIELLMALAFKIKGKGALIFLACTNVVTQVILNVLLNIIYYSAGSFLFILGYIALELAVFLIEALVYCLVLPRLAKRRRLLGTYILYPLAANAASFIAGMGLSFIWPGIF